jgi:hypothetical protein
LLYRPRRRFSSLVRQRRGYANGGAYSLLKERTPIVRQSLLDEARVILRTVGRLMVREKQWRPTALAAHALDEWFRFYATQRLPNERVAGLPDLVLDFTVDPATPVVGGLALLAPASDTYRYATEGIGDVSVTLLEALARPGDVVLDDGAGVGGVSLCAALCVGPSGRVVAVEPDGLPRGLLVQNLARHGVGGRVSVVEAWECEALSPEQVALARIDIERSGASRTLGRFNSQEWTFWHLDERRRSVSPATTSHVRQPSGVVLAVPRSRSAHVTAAIGRLGRSASDELG